MHIGNFGRSHGLISVIEEVESGVLSPWGLYKSDDQLHCSFNPPHTSSPFSLRGTQHGKYEPVQRGCQQDRDRDH